MADDQQTCRGTRNDGEPCRQTEMLNDEGLCPAHRPGAQERLREAGRRGGEATASRRRGEDTLDPDALGELDSYSDAKRWLGIIARSVLSGAIDRERADPAVRAIRQWLEAHRSRVEEEKLEELERRLEAIEAGGDGRPPSEWGPGAGG